MATLTGAAVIADSVTRLGVDTVFGIVGIPVVEVANALIDRGVKFIAFRNEQAASYAASVYGYLTGKPGVLLVVGGPGITHVIAGIYNASSNVWPLLVLAGSASFDENNKGGFQELDQVSFLAPHTKLAVRPFHTIQIPRLLEKAYRESFYGVPGVTYVDLPANIIQGTFSDDSEGADTLKISVADIQKAVAQVLPPPPAPKSQADPETVALVAKEIAAAKSPLVIVGKGAAYGNSSSQLQDLISKYNLPFLPTPMGKGVLPDSHELNVSAARSLALASTDLVILCGARLNWILHSGERFASGTKIIQIDNNATEIGYNSSISAKYGLVGDVGLVVDQISLELNKLSYRSSGLLKQLESKIKVNSEKALVKTSVPTPKGESLSYHRVYEVIKEEFHQQKLFSESEITFVSEGANTMDISRTAFPLEHPKKRLDAGTNATMGVGIPYAITAQLANPNELVLALEGDSAFGFTAMELETIARNKLGIIIVVMNNSGIYHGSDPLLYESGIDKPLPSTALSQNTRYDLLAQGLGIHGVLVDDEASLQLAISDAIKASKRGEATLINTIIDLGLKTKLAFGWQKKSKL